MYRSDISLNELADIITHALLSLTEEDYRICGNNIGAQSVYVLLKKYIKDINEKSTNL